LLSVKTAENLRLTPYERPSRTVIFIAFGLATIGLHSSVVRAEDSRDRLTRIARTSILADSSELGRLLKKKLYVTDDDVARYVFLTNGNDGDRSVAVYRAAGKASPLQGSYWVTATEASTALDRCIPYEGQEEASVDPKSVLVQRYDAPLPASTAQAVHELWLAMLERSQPESEIQIAPTGVFSATNARGTRLRAATSWLGDNSISFAMMTMGWTLIEYPKKTAAERAKLASVIEKESKRLLDRVRQGPAGDR
jgi:hypothetical protein